MTCCDVEPIGTLTGVLAHFRCNQRAHAKRRRRKEDRTRSSNHSAAIQTDESYQVSAPLLIPAGDGVIGFVGSAGRRGERVHWGEGSVGGRAGSEAHSTPFQISKAEQESGRGRAGSEAHATP